jgi:hypothetical protein
MRIRTEVEDDNSYFVRQDDIMHIYFIINRTINRQPYVKKNVFGEC